MGMKTCICRAQRREEKCPLLRRCNDLVKWEFANECICVNSNHTSTNNSRIDWQNSGSFEEEKRSHETNEEKNKAKKMTTQNGKCWLIPYGIICQYSRSIDRKGMSLGFSSCTITYFFTYCNQVTSFFINLLARFSQCQSNNMKSGSCSSIIFEFSSSYFIESTLIILDFCNNKGHKTSIIRSEYVYVKLALGIVKKQNVNYSLTELRKWEESNEKRERQRQRKSAERQRMREREKREKNRKLVERTNKSSHLFDRWVSWAQDKLVK